MYAQNAKAQESHRTSWGSPSNSPPKGEGPCNGGEGLYERFCSRYWNLRME